MEQSKVKYNYDPQIYDDEKKVLNIFLDQYRNKNVIVADEHRVDYDVIPFCGDRVAFRANEDHWKSLDFKRRIEFGGTPYQVILGLWRTMPNEKTPKCLTISELSIQTPGNKHKLSLSTGDTFQEELLFNIIDIFDENKIISPASAYIDRMYTNKRLQEFIANHDWNSILKGINQMPKLANALFIMGEPYKGTDCYVANFGTILYQLIEFRNNNQAKIPRKKLIELDKAILELSKTELLKVRVSDDIGNVKSGPTKTNLLDMYYRASQSQRSNQYTVENGELVEENNTLNKVLMRF